MSVFTRNFADVNTSEVIAITNFGKPDVIDKGNLRIRLCSTYVTIDNNSKQKTRYLNLKGRP
jgi:hypothetical protein